MTRATPAVARRIRSASQVRGLRRTRRSRGTRSTSPNSAPIPALRSRLPMPSLVAVAEPAVSLTLQSFDFPHARERTAHVGNGNRAAHNQRNVQRIDDFIALPALFAATHQMIGDAVVAAKHRGRHQAQKFLGFCAQRARLIGLMIEREKSLHAQMSTTENLFVQIRAKFLKIIQTIRHKLPQFQVTADPKLPALFRGALPWLCQNPIPDCHSRKLSRYLRASQRGARMWSGR